MPPDPVARPPRIVSYAQLLEEGWALRTAPSIVVMLDPSGEGDDRTGLVALERHELELGERHDPDFQVEHVFLLTRAERLERDMEFPDVIATLLAFHRYFISEKGKKRINRHWFGIEANGVGWPFASQLRQMIGSDHVLAITTTGAANDLPWSEGGWVMPRMAGLDLLRMMTQLQRFQIKKGAVGKDLIIREMQSFAYKGKRPEAMEGAHDDLVMAAAGALWLGCRIIPPLVKAEPALAGFPKRLLS